MPETRSHP